MKNILVIIVTMASILACSCTKEENAQMCEPAKESRVRSFMREGGEDDDKPILKIVTKDVEGVPLNGSDITVYNDTDTVRVQTDALGQSTFQVPATGVWNITIEHSDFLTINTDMEIVDSFTQDTVILYRP